MPRRTLFAQTSWDAIYNYIAYVEIALSLAATDGDKEIAPLVAPVQKLLDKWETLDGVRRSRQTEVIRANALVALRDVGLDQVTTQLHNTVLSESDLNREAPLFTRLFPKPLSKIVSMSLDAQLGASRTLLYKLAPAETPDETSVETPAAIRKAHDKPLRDSIAAGEAAIKNREAARAAMQVLTTQIAGLRTEANNVLLTIEGSLKTIAGKRKLGVSFVNAFFPTARQSSKRRAEPAPTSAAAPAAS